MAVKGTKKNQNKANESRSRKTLSFVLNVLSWIIFVGTFVLDSRQKDTEISPDHILTETIEITEPDPLEELELEVNNEP